MREPDSDAGLGEEGAASSAPTDSVVATGVGGAKRQSVKS